MRRALDLARLGWGSTAPNPMVGAVVVSGGGEVAGEGFHARFGEDHAEVIALRAASDRARGATMYVTLEPCAHFGKTPPCVDAITRAGIARVVIAVRDPSELAAGGAERLRRAGIQVDVGCERDAALELNAAFFNAHRSPLPWVTLKLALSADDAIAGSDSTQRWITGEAARRQVHVLRAGNDAVAVGIRTVLADDPLLTVRDALAPRCPPRRVVFDSSLKIPLDSALVRSTASSRAESPGERGETIVVARRDADPGRERRLVDRGVTVLHAKDLVDGLRQLRRSGIRSLLVEGGARLAGSLLRDGLVHRLITFRAPTELGSGALGAWEFAPPDMRRRLAAAPVVEERDFGVDHMTTYALQPIPCSPA